MHGAKLWFPCLDSLHSLSTFEFLITTVPEAIVICSGDLTEQILNENSTLKTSHFIQRGWPIAARSVSMAVGPFKVLPDPLLPHVTYFYLPHHNLNHVRHTVQFVPRIFHYFETNLRRKYTQIFGSYKLVFVDSAYDDVSSYASMSILDSTMILDPKMIDNTRTSVTRMAEVIARQYCGHFLLAGEWADTWLLVGLSGYLSLQYMQEEFGKNELRYFVFKEAKKLLRMETHVQPLYCTNFSNPAELLTPLLLRKSPMVIYMIDRSSQSHLKQLISGLIQVCFTNPHDPRKRLLTTREFLKTIQRTYLVDLKNFADYWIYSTGIPQLDIYYTYDAERSVVELRVKQNLPFAGAKVFTGAVTVRIHEIEGDYDHVIEIQHENDYIELPCRSKPRRRQRKKVEDEGIVKDKEEIEAARIEIPLKWIRIDPEQDWLKVMKFQQKSDLWMQQLEKDKDVIAQHEAISALYLDPQKSGDVLDRFDEILTDKDKHYFYQIRIQTAYTMSKFADSSFKQAALDKLFTFFKSKYYDEKKEYPRPNDFTDIAEYYVKQKIPLAMSKFVDDTTKETPPGVIEFLLELIKSNDDVKNPYSSSHYIASIIRACGQVESGNSLEIEKTLKGLLVMDSLLPSYHQCISVECLFSMANLVSKKHLAFDVKLFKNYYKAGSSYFVRVAAWRGLMHILQSHLLFFDIEEQTKEMKDSLLVRITEHAMIDLFLGTIENPTESAKFKNEIMKITTEAIQRCSAKIALLHQKDALVDVMSQVGPLGHFLVTIRSPSKDNRPLVERVFMLMRGSMTEYDQRLRFSAIRLYSAIWNDLPNCYNPQLLQQKTKRTVEELALDSVGVAQIIDEEMAVDNDVLSERITTASEDSAPLSDKKSKKRRLRDDVKIVESKKKRVESSSSSTRTSASAASSSSTATEAPPAAPPKQKARAERPTTPPLTVKLSVTPPPTASESTVAVVRKAPPRRSLKAEMAILEKHKAQQEELRKRLEASDECEKIIMIYMTGSKMRIYVNMYTCPTADALLRSCPMTSTTVSGSKGIIWFALPGMEKIELEENSRSVIENGEIAYWQAGNSICIAYGKTLYTTENEIRLLEPCSIFGRKMYSAKNLNKCVGAQEVQIRRMKRLVLTIQPDTESVEVQVDLYEKHFDLLLNRVLKALPISSCVEIFGQLLYFQAPFFEFDDSGIKSDEFWRDYLYPGEIAYWANGKSILLGTGETPNKSNKAGTYKLIDKVFVFGRMVSQNFRRLTKIVKLVDLIHMHERQVQITWRSSDFNQVKISVVATLHETTTADRIYAKLPFVTSCQSWGNCFCFDTGTQIATTEDPVLIEGNVMKQTVVPGELAYWCERNMICMGFGKTETSQDEEPSLPAQCNIWATVTSHTSDQLVELLSNVTLEDTDVVTLEKYFSVSEAQLDFMQRHGTQLNDMIAQQQKQLALLQQQQQVPQ